MLSYLGLHVLKREIIFIDIAMAQFAALGAVSAHILFSFHSDSPAAFLASLAATLVASLFFAATRRRLAHLHIEAVIGIAYAVAAAATLLIIGTGTGGHTHIQQMLSGSILWTTWRDLGACAAAFAFVGLSFYVFRRPFQQISQDYRLAARSGRHVVAWDFAFYALCGLVITVAVRVAGVVVVFTFLIIPATASALYATRWTTRLLLAWFCGGVASVLGLAFGYRLDFSAGISVSLFLGVLLVLMAAAAAWRTGGDAGPMPADQEDQERQRVPEHRRAAATEDPLS
jgi:zinc/manganese transport system permease protein